MKVGQRREHWRALSVVSRASEGGPPSPHDRLCSESNFVIMCGNSNTSRFILNTATAGANISSCRFKSRGASSCSYMRHVSRAALNKVLRMRFSKLSAQFGSCQCRGGRRRKQRLRQHTRRTQLRSAGCAWRRSSRRHGRRSFSLWECTTPTVNGQGTRGARRPLRRRPKAPPLTRARTTGFVCSVAPPGGHS